MSDVRATPSVIIADNNEFYRQVLGDFYRELGFQVRVAADGVETLEMLETSRPDLLVLDLIMPRFDGARLSTYLKSQGRYRGIPIIILSGILADEIEGVEHIQADAYIAKMPLDQIRATLKDVSQKLVVGRAAGRPILSGFERMFRREVVVELLQERRASRLTLDSLSEGIVELSPDRRILSCNKAFQQIMGRPARDLLARCLDDLLADGRPVVGRMFDEVGRGEGPSAAVVRVGDRELQLKLHRLEPDPSRAEPAAGAGYTLLVEEITQRVKVEREREQLRARLAQSEKMSSLGLFVAGAAHELNNPLTSVLGYAQLLVQKNEGAELQRDLEKIATGASRCKAILENLMAFARSNRPAKSPTDLNALLVESLAGPSDKVSAAGVEVVLDMQPDLPQTSADPAQLVGAFNAIIDNSVKALAAHGGRRLLSITSRECAGNIVIEFSDTGPGIPSEILARVFEPFFSTRQIGQGIGLGLSMAYGIAKAHAGRIVARNRPEGGATVTLEFPVMTGQTQPSADRPADSAGAGRAEPRRILIVDDEAVVQELLIDILEGEDYRIDTASSGQDGLRKMGENDYDAVILDLRMPDMSGQQVYEQLARRHPELLNRLLFITADNVTAEVDTFLADVQAPFLTKPFSVVAVRREVLALLSVART